MQWQSRRRQRYDNRSSPIRDPPVAGSGYAPAAPSGWGCRNSSGAAQWQHGDCSAVSEKVVTFMPEGSFDSIEEMLADIESTYRRWPWHKRLRVRLALKRRYRDLRYWVKRRFVYDRQRRKQGWATNDTWSFDHYLAGVIAGGIRELQARNFGTPTSVCFDRHGSYLDCPDRKGCSDAWAKILGEIAHGFELQLDLYGEEYPRDEVKRSFELLQHHFGDLWD